MCEVGELVTRLDEASQSKSTQFQVTITSSEQDVVRLNKEYDTHHK